MGQPIRLNFQLPKWALKINALRCVAEGGKQGKTTMTKRLNASVQRTGAPIPPAKKRELGKKVPGGPGRPPKGANPHRIEGDNPPMIRTGGVLRSIKINLRKRQTGARARVIFRGARTRKILRGQYKTRKVWITGLAASEWVRVREQMFEELRRQQRSGEFDLGGARARRRR